MVTGESDNIVILASLFRFIKKYVLCPKCNDPELKLRVNKKKLIKADCKACSFNDTLDNNHKLASYI